MSKVYYDSDDLSPVLAGRYVTKVDGDTLTLDDGTVLAFEGQRRVLLRFRRLRAHGNCSSEAPRTRASCPPRSRRPSSAMTSTTTPATPCS